MRRKNKAERRVLKFVDRIMILEPIETYGVCAVLGIKDADKLDPELLIEEMIDAFLELEDRQQKSILKILRQAVRSA